MRKYLCGLALALAAPCAFAATGVASVSYTHLVQRALLVEATRERSDLDDLDWDALDRRVRETLAPLPTEA